jgi:nitroreductase
MDKPANTDLPIHELLKKRWSPRAFSDRPVSDSDLRLLLEAARWAPSAMNEQPWRLIVARRENREEFDRLAACLAPANRVWAQHASVLIAVVARETYRRNGKPNPHAWHDTGQAIAHITVQATALGLAVHQMGGFDSDAVRSTYGVPEGFSPVSVVAIGYGGEPDQLPDELAQRERAARTRVDPSEIFFGQEWDQPLRLLS